MGLLEGTVRSHSPSFFVWTPFWPGLGAVAGHEGPHQGQSTWEPKAPGVSVGSYILDTPEAEQQDLKCLPTQNTHEIYVTR